MALAHRLIHAVSDRVWALAYLTGWVALRSYIVFYVRKTIGQFAMDSGVVLGGFFLIEFVDHICLFFCDMGDNFFKQKKRKDF